MTEKFTQWDPVDYLETENDQALYLNVCLDEDPGEGSLIRTALGDIARANGMSQLVHETGICTKGFTVRCPPTAIQSSPPYLKSFGRWGSSCMPRRLEPRREITRRRRHGTPIRTSRSGRDAPGRHPAGARLNGHRSRPSTGRHATALSRMFNGHASISRLWRGE